ncbi:MAG: ABC transporter permease subunit [Halobacteriaceae archaeon]
MSIRTVAKKDFKTASRSKALWSVAIGLGLLFTLITYGYPIGRSSLSQAVMELLTTLTMAIAILLPIVALVSSYMAIAGERASGGIKFLLSFPNTRRDVFLGKLFSRITIVGAGVVFIFGATVSMILAKYSVVPIQTVIGLFVLTVGYGAIFVGIAVALSAAVASRTRAIATAIGAYFLLVIFYVVPFFRFSTIIQWIHTTILGFSPNPDLYNAITYTSPFIAFRKATNLVFPDNHDALIFQRATEVANSSLPFYLTDVFSLVIVAVWLILPPVIGYFRFNRADLV